MKLATEKRAYDLIATGDATLEHRCRDLVTLKKRIGHSFAFWICADYYATKQGPRVRLFHIYSNSKPANGHLVLDITIAEPETAARALLNALRGNVAARTS